MKSSEHSRGRRGDEDLTSGTSLRAPREALLVTELFASLDVEVLVEAAEPFAGLDLLLPEERPAVARAVEKRIREFATGRVLARKALARLGFPEGPLPIGPDRAPIWPGGSIGTITHTKELCVVGCSTPHRARAIGLDVERLRDMKEGLAERILRPTERAEQGTHPTLAYFCAKEAVYKCQHPLSAQFLEFQDVSIRFSQDLSEFEATIHVQPDGSTWKHIPGRLLMTSDHVVAAAALQPGT